MTVAQLEGFTAGVLGHTSYQVQGSDVLLSTNKDLRKMVLALAKQRMDFIVLFADDQDSCIRVL